jgi:hypothetical protein
MIKSYDIILSEQQNSKDILDDLPYNYVEHKQTRCLENYLQDPLYFFHQYSKTL